MYIDQLSVLNVCVVMREDACKGQSVVPSDARVTMKIPLDLEIFIFQLFLQACKK